jgi:putative nucleotidyltransferase with HDIG domain
MEARSGSSPKGDHTPPRKPARKIVYAFVLVLGAMGLLPLGIAAFKLIDISRESLVTSQQAVQLQVATSTVRQLDAAVHGTRAQMERLAGAISALPGGAAGRPDLRSQSGTTLLKDFLGDDLLLLRYLPSAGQSAEARRADFTPSKEVETAIRSGRSAAQKGQTEVSEPSAGRTADGPATVLIVTVPVGKPRPTGVLAGVFDFDTFWQPLVGGRRRDYTIYAIDRKGELFASQEDDGILSKFDYQSFGVVQEFMQSRGYSALTTEFVLDVGSEPVEYIASFDTTDLGWGIFVQIDKRQAYAAVNQMVQTTFLWAVLAMAAALVLAYFLAATVTRPIKTLAAGTEAFARGELGHRVQVSSRNELGALAETFNAMAQQIQSYIQRLSAAAQLNNELFMGTVKSLAEAIDEKDPYTRGHSERVNRYAVLLARQLGLGTKEIRAVHIGSLFHDIGKIGIEDKILRKPAALTDEEFQVMKRHPEKGAQMLSKIKAMKDIVPAVRLHHERWDGTGYPLGLKAEQIPLSARIVCVADAFDAMTTNRPYQKSMSYEKAITRLFELSDRVFDRRVVSAFAEAYKSGVIKEPRAMAAEER